jgi:hypothetical protein
MKNEPTNGDLTLRPKLQIHRAIIKKLATKAEWRTAREIMEIISPEFDQPVVIASVKDCLYRFKPSEKFPYRAEQTGYGDTAKYRFVRVKGTILNAVYDLAAEYRPAEDYLLRCKHPIFRRFNRGHLDHWKDVITAVLQTPPHLEITEANISLLLLS